MARLGHAWLAWGKGMPGELGRWSLLACPDFCVESRLSCLPPKGKKSRHDCGPCDVVNRCLSHTVEVSWPSRDVQVADGVLGNSEGRKLMNHSWRANKLLLCATTGSPVQLKILMWKHVIQEAMSTRQLSDPRSPLPGLTITSQPSLTLCLHVSSHSYPDSHPLFPSPTFRLLATIDITFPWAHLFPELTPSIYERAKGFLPRPWVSWIFRRLCLCQHILIILVGHLLFVY